MPERYLLKNIVKFVIKSGREWMGFCLYKEVKSEEWFIKDLRMFIGLLNAMMIIKPLALFSTNSESKIYFVGHCYSIFAICTNHLNR